MKTILDLPAHILFIHVVVVFAPLLGVAAVAVAVRPAWRRRFGPWLVGGALFVFISIVLTASSGEALDEVVGKIAPTKKHKELGETARLMSAGLLVSVAGLVAYPAWRARTNRDADFADDATSTTKVVVAIFTVATLAFAVLSTVWVIRTGHEGARITWDGTL